MGTFGTIVTTMFIISYSTLVFLTVWLPLIMAYVAVQVGGYGKLHQLIDYNIIRFVYHV
jgi:hypothetical protein